MDTVVDGLNGMLQQLDFRMHDPYRLRHLHPRFSIGSSPYLPERLTSELLDWKTNVHIKKLVS